MQFKCHINIKHLGLQKCLSLAIVIYIILLQMSDNFVNYNLKNLYLCFYINYIYQID